MRITRWRAEVRVRAATRRGIVRPVSATFVFLMVVLKVPIAGLLYIVWWAINAQPEPLAADDDGGTKQPHDAGPRHPRHPRPTLPRPPRRGPHGARPAPAPPRVRTVRARARRVAS
jgi:hypothetical protein